MISPGALQRALNGIKENDSTMILIAGLGNPGKEYENTRHNAGFLVLDTLAQKLGADLAAM